MNVLVLNTFAVHEMHYMVRSQATHQIVLWLGPFYLAVHKLQKECQGEVVMSGNTKAANSHAACSISTHA